MKSLFIAILSVIFVCPVTMAGALEPIPSLGLRPGAPVRVQTPTTGQSDFKDSKGRLQRQKNQPGVVKDRDEKSIGQEMRH